MNLMSITTILVLLNILNRSDKYNESLKQVIFKLNTMSSCIPRAFETFKTKTTVNAFGRKDIIFSATSLSL